MKMPMKFMNKIAGSIREMEVMITFRKKVRNV